MTRVGELADLAYPHLASQKGPPLGKLHRHGLPRGKRGFGGQEFLHGPILAGVFVVARRSAPGEAKSRRGLSDYGEASEPRPQPRAVGKRRRDYEKEPERRVNLGSPDSVKQHPGALGHTVPAHAPGTARPAARARAAATAPAASVWARESPGWVEAIAETHHNPRRRMMGFAALYPHPTSS